MNFSFPLILVENVQRNGGKKLFFSYNYSPVFLPVNLCQLGCPAALEGPSNKNDHNIVTKYVS